MVWGQMNLVTCICHCLSDGLHFREIDVPDIGWKICSHCEREKRRGEREKGERERERERERDQKGELNYAANAYICVTRLVRLVYLALLSARWSSSP